MIRMNTIMESEYKKLPKRQASINRELHRIAQSGFEYVDGCYFIKLLSKISTNVALSDFPDKTGYECFINSVHIDDYVDNSYLEQGLLFVNEVFKSWKETKIDNNLVAILSLGEFGLNVKFHVERKGEEWISDPIGEYKEGIMIVRGEFE